MDKHEIPQQPQSGPLTDLIRRFSHHPPRNAEEGQVHEHVRAMFMQTARDVIAFVPPGREQALVLTKLEEAMFWANAAIARARE